MNFYEHTLVAKQDLSTAELDNVHNKYNDIINKSAGEVIKVEKWGLLNFAKKIKSYNKGFYIHYKFKGNSKTLDEIKKNISIDNSILRYLTIKYKKLDLDKEYFNKEDKIERSQNPLNKLSLFQKSDSRFSKKCPLSIKDAPIVDYKNIKLLKRYISDTDKLLPSRITSVSQGKQKKLANEIKKAKILGLL